MSKYASLADYLSQSPVDQVRLTFSEIEHIIGATLPGSAREYQAWWSNSRTDDSHTWAHLWLAVGWERDKLNLREGWVTFRRAESGSSTETKASAEGSPWTSEELRASVQAYLEMLDKYRRGESFSKKSSYATLEKTFGRTAKAYEYRMQNISYVLSLLGRQWLTGLKPAKNVGSKVAGEIEALIAELEGSDTAPVTQFEIQVKDELKKENLPKPTGSAQPAKTTSSVSQYVRDPKVKAWVLQQAMGRCECCGVQAPFTTEDGLPYLEVHHLRRLADHGPDTVSNAVAICPNCHRELHFGTRRDSLLKSFYANIPRLRPVVE